MKFPRAMYSLRMSFCVGAAELLAGRRPAPRRRARRAAAARAAGALIVIEVETSSSGIPSNAVRMSSSVSIATPVRPTSPRQRGSSESRPSWVGRSKAMLRPVRAVLEQVAVALVGLLRASRSPRTGASSTAACGTSRGATPRVNGNSPGSPSRSSRSSREVVRRVERLDLDAGVREAPRVVRADDRRDGEIVGFLEVLVVDGHGPQITRRARWRASPRSPPGAGSAGAT